MIDRRIHQIVSLNNNLIIIKTCKLVFQLKIYDNIRLYTIIYDTLIGNLLNNIIIYNIINTQILFQVPEPISLSPSLSSNVRVQRAGGSSPLGDVVAEADRVRVLKDGRHNTRES